jgi:hypothetical protein
MNPITHNINDLRGGITSVETPLPPTHDYQRPALPITEEGPSARTLDEFVRPISSDPDELLKHRFLCRKGALLLVGAIYINPSI